MKKSRTLSTLDELKEDRFILKMVKEHLRFLNAVAEVEYPGDPGSVVKLENYFANDAKVHIIAYEGDPETTTATIEVNPFQDEGGPTLLTALFDDYQLAWMVLYFDASAGFIIKDGQTVPYDEKTQTAQPIELIPAGPEMTAELKKLKERFTRAKSPIQKAKTLRRLKEFIYRYAGALQVYVTDDGVVKPLEQLPIVR